MALGGESTREHEEYAIVNLLCPHLGAVINFLEQDQRVGIVTACLSPLGLGFIQFGTVV